MNVVKQYNIRKISVYGYPVSGMNDYARENGLVVTYAYVNHRLIAIVGKTKVTASDYVVVQEDYGGIYAYNRGIPVHRMILKTNSYKPKIVDDISSISGYIDVYEIW